MIGILKRVGSQSAHVETVKMHRDAVFERVENARKENKGHTATSPPVCVLKSNPRMGR